MAPSPTSSSATRRRSAGSSRPFGHATRSRTSTGALRWFRPTRTMPRSTLEGLPEVAEGEDVDADERDQDHREARDREGGGAPPAPAGRHAALEQHDVDGPDDEGEEQLRVGGPGEPPRGVRPDDAAHDAGRQEHQAP